jgi:hypothetical protein
MTNTVRTTPTADRLVVALLLALLGVALVGVLVHLGRTEVPGQAHPAHISVVAPEPPVDRMPAELNPEVPGLVTVSYVQPAQYDDPNEAPALYGVTVPRPLLWYDVEDQPAAVSEVLLDLGFYGIPNDGPEGQEVERLYAPGVVDVEYAPEWVVSDLLDAGYWGNPDDQAERLYAPMG